MNKREHSFMFSNSSSVTKEVRKAQGVRYIESLDFENFFNNIVIMDLYKATQKAFEIYAIPRYCSEKRFKDILRFIIFNNYLYDGETIYLQHLGVPVGAGASSVLSNIYLHIYEKEAYGGMHECQIFRFIADILVVGYLDEGYALDFYPDNLKLIKNHTDQGGWLVFIDIQIKIDNGKLVFRIYDKRKHFKFKVNAIGIWDTNLHKSILQNLIK